MVTLFFLGYIGWLAVSTVRREWLRARDPARYPVPRRLPSKVVRNLAGRQLLFVAVLGAAFALGDWSWPSIGVPARIRWPETLLAGEVGFAALLLTYVAILLATRRLAVMRRVATRGNLRLWPRRRRDKWIAAIAIMVFNPFVEEIVMRGILIHHWALALGSPVLPIVVGCVLNGILHWYQGWRMQVWHALYFVVAVTLLYSPSGLPAAIFAHVFGDVIPILTLRRSLRVVRKAHLKVLREKLAKAA